MWHRSLLRRFALTVRIFPYLVNKNLGAYLLWGAKGSSFRLYQPKVFRRIPCAYIRYDFDGGSFRTGVHPAAHIHIGLDNPIRIGLGKQLTPLAFLLFVIRQMYPENWERLLNNSVHRTLPNKLHINLEKVDDKYFGEHEKSDLYLMGRDS
jgi:hypothetical protein